MILKKSYEELVAEVEELRRRETQLKVKNKQLEEREVQLLKKQDKLEFQLNQYKNAISLSNKQFKILADNIPVIVWTADADGALDYYNERGFEYTGQTEEEAKGWGWGPILHPDDLVRTIATWNRSLENTTAYEIEYRLKRKSDNIYRWHLGKAIPLKDKDGKVVKWFGTNTDIQEQKEIENKKDEFISIASHELKTPLTTIKAYIQISKNNTSRSEKSYPYIKKAEEQVGRLEGLISDLLDVSKINAGKMMYNLEELNFNEIIEASIETIQHASSKHRIILEESVDVLFKGDRVRLEQVMNNLLVNAVKYSPEADKVIVTCKVQRNNIIVSVRDFGIGIAAGNLKNLFDRFYRVDNSNTKFQGLGLGLYIASEIIKRHNGSFWIESEIGKGSTFYFILPIKGKFELKTISTDNVTYYKGNFVEIKYNQQKDWLEASWLGYQNYDSVVKGCLIMLDLLKKNNCSAVLNDNSEVIGNWSEAVDWGGQIWFPKMEEAGLKQFAWIYSPSTFSMLSANKMFDINPGTISNRFFSNKQEAINWLEESKRASIGGRN